MILSQLYEEYGKAMVEMEILQNRINDLKRQLVPAMNQTEEKPMDQPDPEEPSPPEPN